MSAALLSAAGVTLSFGGVRAADGVDVEVETGEFLAIIGPNGSGKTTFLNLCTGYLRPTAGSIRLEGRVITGLSPRAIARLGIARAFQIPQLFAEHSLLENVMLAVAAEQGFWRPLRPLDRPAHRKAALPLLELMKLDEHAERAVSELSEGIRKLADIALALALRPKLLLLDEPTSGVSNAEKFALVETLAAALHNENVTAVFVEHDMEVVRSYADRVLVWDQGRIVADGPPNAILSDPRVLQNVVGVT